MTEAAGTPGRPYAVITGASSGIGLQLARQFSGHGFDVLMAAEDDGVHAAAEDLGGQGLADAFQVDLTDGAGVERLWASIVAGGRPVDALAVNAGVGNAGAFVETSLEADLHLLRLNVVSAVHLTKLVLPTMVERRTGRVLFTASVAATMPGPYYATYAASKSFVLSFAAALRSEVADRGVTVTALLPGPTDTRFFRRAGMQGSLADEGPKDDPADVARDGFEALMAGKDHVVAGALRNRLQAALAKALPQRLTAALHGRQARPGRTG